MSATPHYITAEDGKSSDELKGNNYHTGHAAAAGHGSHHFQRPHRTAGQLELGATEIVEGRSDVQRQVVASGGISQSRFRHVWDQRKPQWLMAALAEATGVWFFTYAGQISTATFVISEGQLGSIFQIAIAYSLGIVFAITVCASTSGGHFHPAITIAQVVFKGFPAKKAPLYIFAQLLGGFVASLMVYAQWRTEMLEMTAALTVAGKRAQVFSSQGPAGIIALFPVAGRNYGEMFATEFFSDIAIALVIWSQLDAQNVFTGPTLAPYSIGLSFGLIVMGNSYGAVALNTGRDLGARFACGTIWGSECFPARYTALAALTNILGSLVAIGFYTFLFSDTRRPPVSIAMSHHAEEERQRHIHATETHDELLDKRIARTISRGGDPSALQSMKSRQQ